MNQIPNKSVLSNERDERSLIGNEVRSWRKERGLTGAELALVSDIGGTTTDVALLKSGRPKIDPAGARVGP